MISSDRVIKAGQWSVSASSSGSPKPDFADIRISRSPDPVHFTLNPQDTYDLAGLLLLIVRHAAEEGTAGELKVSVSGEPNEVGIRLLRLEFPESFPGERSIFFTDIVANAFAYDLLVVAERLIELGMVQL